MNLHKGPMYRYMYKSIALYAIAVFARNVLSKNLKSLGPAIAPHYLTELIKVGK